MNAKRKADVQAMIDHARALREISRRTRKHATAARTCCDRPLSRASAETEQRRPQFGLAGRGEGYVVVEAVGAIDVATEHALSEVLKCVVENGVPQVIVDLTAVTLLSAAAVHCLDHVAGPLSRRGGGLHVVCPPDSTTARILRILDPDHHWPRYSDVPTAIAAMTSAS